MGDRIDLKEVRELAYEVEKETESIQETLTKLKADKEAIINMDNLTGQAASSVKMYLKELHDPLNEFFESLFRNINKNFENHISKFQSKVDPNESTVIERQYLYMEVEILMENQHRMFDSSITSLEKALSGISDIVPISAPTSDNINRTYYNLSKGLETLQDNFITYTQQEKSNINKVDEILKGIQSITTKVGAVDVSERFAHYKSGKGNKHLFKSKEVVDEISNIKDLVDSAAGSATSVAGYGQKKGATQPSIKESSSALSKKEKAKYIGKQGVKGSKTALKDTINIKPKTLGKALGPLGAGLDGYTNYQDARIEGLNKRQATLRAIADTAVDTAVSGGVMTGSIAAGTVLIPIPVVGSVAGALGGLFITSFLNKERGDTQQSIMDHVKSPFRKVASWFG